MDRRTRAVSDGPPELLHVRSRVQKLQATLRAQHGWTHVEVTLAIDAPRRRLIVSGEVAVAGLVAVVVAAIAEVMPGWEVDGDGLRPMVGGPWHTVLGPLVLWARCPSKDPGTPIATELRAEDGPIQWLGSNGAYRVVRGRDGTVGWIEEGLGAIVAPRPLSSPGGDHPRALVDRAEQWVGTPYRLGGTSEHAIDCSALIQRVVSRTLGVLLPRHSSDQLQVASRTGAGTASGDLCFVWSEREARCHVGLVTGPTVIHASRSRQRVVEDSRAQFVAGARRVRHVPFAELLAFGHRVAGAPSLVAAGFTLGHAADLGNEGEFDVKPLRLPYDPNA